jgi:O-antigen/teichoic acid export membrane protein
MAMGVNAGLTAVSGSLGVTLAGILGSARDAGLLGASVRVGTVLLLTAWAANQALSPVVATLYASGDMERLRRGATAVARRVSAATLVVATGVFVLAGPLLSVFGAGFEDGATALRLLCLAGLVNAFAAANSTLLTMTKHERTTAVVAVCGVVMTAILCVALIPPFGAAGGAAAYLGGQIVRNGLASWWTWSLLGVDSTILGRRPR